MLVWITSRIKRWFSRGARGERIAARHLKKRGYHILAMNLRTRLGEVDVLAEAPDRRTIVVVEVKTRLLHAGSAVGSLPELRVNKHKQMKLTLLAQGLARRYRWDDRPVRFDVVAVDLVNGGEPVVRHHPGAFESRR